MVFEGLVGLGIAMLLAPAIAEYAKIRNKADRAFNFIASAGVCFLFASTLTVASSLRANIPYASGIEMVVELVGWLLALIGTVFVAYQILWVER